MNHDQAACEEATRAYYEALSLCRWNLKQSDPYLLRMARLYAAHVAEAGDIDKASAMLYGVIDGVLRHQQQWKEEKQQLVQFKKLLLQGKKLLLQCKKPLPQCKKSVVNCKKPLTLGKSHCRRVKSHGHRVINPRPYGYCRKKENHERRRRFCQAVSTVPSGSRRTIEMASRPVGPVNRIHWRLVFESSCRDRGLYATLAAHILIQL